FGQVIGFALAAIERGEWVHVHNLAMADIRREASLEPDLGNGLEPAAAPAFFQGFRRQSGRAGTRNYIGILTSVNCSASVARFMAEAVTRSGVLQNYPNVDGVIAFVHGTGCGMAGRGEGYEVLQRTQWGYASNPNLAAVLIVGLGCEVFQIGRMKERYG